MAARLHKGSTRRDTESAVEGARPSAPDPITNALYHTRPVYQTRLLGDSVVRTNPAILRLTSGARRALAPDFLSLIQRCLAPVIARERRLSLRLSHRRDRF